MAKKLLFFIESLDVGGAEKSLVALLNAAKFDGFAVDLMMLKKGTFFTDLPSHINVIILEESNISLFKRIKFYILNKVNTQNLHSAQNFWRVFQSNFQKVKKKYDVAISYSQGFSTYFIAEKVEAERKYSWVNIDYKKAGYDMKFDYPFYEKFDKVIAVSEDVEKGLKHELKNIQKNLPIEIIRDITNDKILKQQALEPLTITFDKKAINIVTVCRLVKQKGLFLAVEACSLLIKNNYKVNWYVIGEGAERKNLEKLIGLKQLQNSFFLLGADANPYPYMKACDIYVQTSLFEGLGLTVIEASYLNKPIVCTNFPTAYDILKDNETGLIAEMNAEAIAKQIERLINNEELREYLINNLAHLKNTDMEESLKNFHKLLCLH